MSSTKKHQPSDAARAGASSPEARAKAVATRKRNMEEKKRLAEEAAQVPTLDQVLALDAIPDREPTKKYARKEKATYMVTEKEWMFLKMAKMLLGEQ